MRRLLIAGNWKMNLDRASAVELASQFAQADLPAEIDVCVCPPYIYLDAIGNRLSGTGIRLGAQDVYYEPPGAFTGEISTSMLLDVGCEYVILGHSERRNVMGESNEVINLKLKAALDADLKPILCVGELLQQRESGATLEVITQQFDGSLAGVSADQMRKIILAYEPVWAIGTGKTATPQQAQEVHSDLRKLMTERYNRDVAEVVNILYGGSVKPANAAELLSQSDIDGALVGGASLDSESFLQIIAAGHAPAAA